MNEARSKASLNVTVFSDYICPFCYIGHLRLAKLREEYDLNVDWRFLEIHPDNPPEGKSVTELGYPPHHWQMLMENLARMAKEEGVDLAERTFTTNSRRALKLAQAVREHQPGVFEALNLELYEAYFLRRENIGDPDTLRSIAAAGGVDPELAERAWKEPYYDEVLRNNQQDAGRLGVTGTPSYLFADQVYSGAIPVHMLRQAAAQSLARQHP